MSYPSTFVDIQNRVVAKLRLDSSLLPTVKDYINLAYTEAVVETEANITSATMVFTAGASSYTFPSAVSRVKEMFVTPVGAANSKPLQATTLDRILSWRQASGGNAVANGYVTHYAFLGLNEFEVFPTPHSADTVTLYYTAVPTVLSADADVPSALPEPYCSRILEFGALAEMADVAGDPSEQEYRQLLEVWKGRMRAHLTRKAGGQPGQFNVFPTGVLRPHDPSVDV